MRASHLKLLEQTGLQFKGWVKIQHLLEIVTDLEPNLLKEHIKKPLKGLKVACYYGCQLVRPKGYDDPEEPKSMDQLMELMGASVVPFRFKTKCCASSLATTNEEVAFKLVKDILKGAQEADADLIVTICPMCQLNLDAYQDQINAIYKANFSIPVIYFTQLLGLA